MKDYAAIFRDLESLPEALRREVLFAAVMWDVLQILELYRVARRDKGEDFAVNWLQRSIRAHDDMASGDVTPLRFRPAVKRKRMARHSWAPEVPVMVA